MQQNLLFGAIAQLGERLPCNYIGAYIRCDCMIEWRRMIYRGRDLGEYYLISNLGDIKSVKTNKVRKQNTLQTGYNFCTISLGGKNKKMCVRIHRAVAETFIENPYNKPEVNHIDGDKSHNYVENLEWVTGKENVFHAFATGLCNPARNETNGMSRLSKKDVAWARSVYKPKDPVYGLRPLSRVLGVDHSTLRSVILCKTWA